MFDEVINDVLSRRGNWEQSAFSVNRLDLCMVGGYFAEWVGTKPKCKGATVQFGMDYEFDLFGLLTGMGIIGLRDKANLKNQLKSVGPYIPKSYPFAYFSASNTLNKYMDGKTIWVIKPRFFSHSNEGVLITADKKLALKTIHQYGIKFPLWILQEYVQSITPFPHYLKLDVFIVYFPGEKKVQYFYNYNMMLYSAHTHNTLKAGIPPIKLAHMNKLSKKQLKQVKGHHMMDAKDILEKHMNTGTFDAMVKRQIPPLLKAVAQLTPPRTLKCSKHTKVAIHHLSFDLILDKDLQLKLIEINVVPNHNKSSKWWVKSIQTENAIKRKIMRNVFGVKYRKYMEQLLDELLGVSMDKVFTTSHKPVNKYLECAV